MRRSSYKFFYNGMHICNGKTFNLRGPDFVPKMQKNDSPLLQIYKICLPFYLYLLNFYLSQVLLRNPFTLRKPLFGYFHHKTYHIIHMYSGGLVCIWLVLVVKYIR